MRHSRSQDGHARPRLTIRIDLASGQIGPGKIRLLEQVASAGSIRAAASAMRMSYRRAWLLIQSLEECFGQALVLTATGGKRGGGAKLSRAGQAVVEAYRETEKSAGKAANRHLAALARLKKG